LVYFSVVFQENLLNITVTKTTWIPVLRIRDVPDPDFYPSRIQKQQQKRGVKKNWHNFLCSHKYHKIANYFYFSFEVLNKKIWATFQRINELFTQKIVFKLSKIWIWDPGSGKNLFRIPDPGVKKAPDPDPQH
jgi:hypothetical protein